MFIKKYSLFISLITLNLLLSLNVQASIWGCKPAKVIAGQSTNGCIKIDGLKRQYRIHTPSGHKNNQAASPLVIGLHGGGGKPKRFESYTGISQLSDRSADFIAVYPAGIDKHWNDGRPNVNAKVDDVKFLKQLIEHIKQDLSLSIDRNRIFVIGMSNGGLMALRLACEQPQIIFGAGIVAATMSTQITQSCIDQSKATSMVFVFGDKDTSFQADGKQVNPVKPSQQRGNHIGIKQTIKRWSDINQCQGVVSSTIDTDPQDGTHIIKNRFHNCTSPMVFFDIKNGGHRWPDSKARNGTIMTKALNLGLASHDMNTAEEILKILLKSE